MIALKEKKYFYFTQNSLQTFNDCPFKFKKIYIDNIKWDKNENLGDKLELGNDFHKIAQRYFMRIPVFEESFQDNIRLYNSFLNLKNYFPIVKENLYYPEYSARYSDNTIRLEANIDLLIVKPDKSIEIWDWKTNADLKISKRYINSLQTQVYMYVVKKTCRDVLGFDINYDKIRMIYFNPEKNLEIASIDYNKDVFDTQEKNIKRLIKNIFSYNYQNFEREKHIKICNFCEFTLFCDNRESDKNEFSLDFIWDDIKEIE